MLIIRAYSDVTRSNEERQIYGIINRLKRKKISIDNFSSYYIPDMGLCESKARPVNRNRACSPTINTKWMSQTWFSSSVWSQQNMVILKGINYQLQIVNSLMNINFKANYYNSSSDFQDVIYTLPLNLESTIYEVWVQFQSFKIEGVVRQKKQSKKGQINVKNESKKAAFKEQNTQCKNILSLTIGNVPPKAQFTIFFSLVQQMTFTLNNFYKLQVPSAISPQSVSMSGKKMEKKYEKMKYQWKFSISIRTSRKIEFFKSPSHILEKVQQNQDKTEMNFTLSEKQIFSKNFILLYMTEDYHLPTYTYGRQDLSASVVLSFIPKFWESDLIESYEASKDGKKIPFDHKQTRGQYIFFIDRGSSMKEHQMVKAKETLSLLIQKLPYDSFFNVVSLGTTFQKMFEQSQSNTKKKCLEAFDIIYKMTANLGQLYLNEPFQKILNEDHIKGYPKHIIFLNSGSAQVSELILRLIQSKRKHCRIHSIAFGKQCSQAIKQIVSHGRGESLTVSLKEKSLNKPLEFLNTILTPVIDDILIKCDDEIVQNIVPKPGENSYILKDQIVNFHITFKKPLNKKFLFEIEYQDSVQVVSHRNYVEINPKIMNFPFVNKLCHAKVLQTLEKQSEDLVKIGGKTLFVKVSGYKEQIMRLSIQHQILSKYTVYLGEKKEKADYKKKSKNEERQTFEIDHTRPTQYEELEAFISSMEPDRTLIVNLNSKQLEDKIFQESENYRPLQKTPPKLHLEQNFNGDDDIFSSIRYISPANSLTSINSSRSQRKSRLGKSQMEKIESTQHADGYWSDLDLLKEQQKKWEKIKQKLYQIDKEIVITYLIVAWIKKYRPSRKLVQQAKKGEKWIKNKIKERKVKEKQLIKLDDFVQ